MTEQTELKHVAASELRAELSAFLGAVQYAGQSLVVTRHGRPVALLLPPIDDESEQSPMAVNVTVGTTLPTPNNEFRSLFGNLGRGDGADSRVFRAVARSLQGDPTYVTDGVADLDAEGYVTALKTVNGFTHLPAGQRNLAQAASALRASAPGTGTFRHLIDLCADAIEAA